MRIISIRPAPVARVFAFTYGICGLAAFTQYAFSSLRAFTLPIGIIMGIFHFNLNINLTRSPDLLANAFLCIGSIFSYAFSGWITGAVVAFSFNFVAEKTGGLDAKYITVAEDASARLPTSPAS